MNTLFEWLGDGGNPVTQDLAEKRSSVCVECPENVEPKWWERMVKDPVAGAIRLTIRLKTDSGLSVSNEDGLHMCRVCGCCNPLKVFVPIEHIRDHTTENELWKFPGHCWIRKELNK